MDPNPSTSLFLVVTIFITIHSVICSSSNNPQYTNCSKPFICAGAGLKELKFPFWGENRARHCGMPEYELRCLSNKLTLTISKHDFIILGTNQQAKTIRVASTEFWNKNNLCPSVSINNTSADANPNASPIDIGSSPFSLVYGLHLVTLLYGCPQRVRTALGWSGLQICSINNTTIEVHYVPNTVNASQTIGCTGVVVLPIPEEDAQAVHDRVSNLVRVLNEGFQLQWLVKESDGCDVCVESGGQCGYDWTGKRFTCYCRDKPYPDKCAATTPGDHNVTHLAIGASIGALLLVAFVLGSWFLFLHQRRKTQIKQEKVSCRLTPTPSSPSNNGLLVLTRGSRPPSSQAYSSTSSTDCSNSLPSYASSRSNTERDNTNFGVRLFDYAELQQATNDFHESRELGSGGYGSVYYGQLLDGRPVAVKRLYESNFKRLEQFMNEIKILEHLRHKNLVTLYGCTSRRSRVLLLVYEYVPNGTLADHLHGKNAESTCLKWPIRLSIAVETAEALAYLHRSAVIHRDVKTTNILLDGNFHVKVADFGLSRLFPNDMSHVSTVPQGTPGYVDPEYYHCYRLTEKSDVYSFGVVLIELISSKQAVDVSRQTDDVNLANMALDRIQNRAMHELVDPRLGFEKDHEVQRMVKMVAELGFRCLQQDKDMRPTMKEAVEALKGIQMQGANSRKQEGMDSMVYGDDVGLLKC